MTRTFDHSWKLSTDTISKNAILLYVMCNRPKENDISHNFKYSNDPIK